MSDSTDTPRIKQCRSRENCVNPLGSWLPATTEFFSPEKKSADRLEYRCKACLAAKAKAYVNKNPEKVKATKKQYRESHKDEITQYNAEYQRRLPKEKKREYDQRYYERHVDDLRVKARKYRTENLDRLREYDKHRTRSPESLERARARNRARSKTTEGRLKQMVHVRNRRARLQNADGKHTQKDIQEMFEEQNGLCAYCGIRIFWEIPRDIHVDHIMPVSRGGSNDTSNLCLTCSDCNWSKNDSTVDEWVSRRDW